VLTPLLLARAGFDQNPSLYKTERAKLPHGKVMLQRMSDKHGLAYYLYIPHSCNANTPLMISVHGVSRNAHEHAELLAPLAEKFGVVLVAPLFTRQMFPDYQRLGRFGRGPRADLALDQIIGDVLYKTECSTESLHLFGFSGGGQFAHRYAMAYPERVAGVVVGAAGWYTFPDLTTRYPRGNAKSKDLNNLNFDPARYLRVPMSVVVGNNDNKRDAELNKSIKIDKQQGENRLQRAEKWISTMRKEAATHNLSTSYNLETMQGIRHSFNQGMKSGDLGERIFRLLFSRLDKSNSGAHASLNPISNNTTPITSLIEVKPEQQYACQKVVK